MRSHPAHQLVVVVRRVPPGDECNSNDWMEDPIAEKQPVFLELNVSEKSLYFKGWTKVRDTLRAFVPGCAASCPRALRSFAVEAPLRGAQSLEIPHQLGEEDGIERPQGKPALLSPGVGLA